MRSRRLLFTTLLGLSVLCVSAATASAQSAQGYNAAMYTSNTTTSLSFVDMVPYTTDTRCTGGSCDICAAINRALNDFTASNYNGVVVDARGVNAGTSQYCSRNPFNSTASNFYSIVVLLPTGTINIQQTWILPAQARVVGQGPTLTVLQACKASTGGCGAALSGDMIDMGNASVCPPDANNHPYCQDVGVEHLGLSGNASVNGIVNMASQELSYVDDVVMTNMAGTGLTVTSTYGNNSGPYSKIFYSGTGACASISGAVREVHGLTCTETTGASGTAVVYVDSSNVNLEDAYIQGLSSQDGILVGSNSNVESSLFFNIRGSGLKNVIHIKPTSGSITITDITLAAISRTGGTATIQDDTFTTPVQVKDLSVGMYVIGDPVKANGTPVGYSRLNTAANIVSSNPATPTWIVGSGAPATPCAPGSLYSRTSGSGALYGCQGPASISNWFKIK